MSWQAAAWLMLGGSTALMFLGLPVAFAFLAINLIGAAIYLGGEPGMVQFARNGVQSVTSFALTPIPLFILMGEVLFHTGVAMKVAHAACRPRPGMPPNAYNYQSGVAGARSNPATGRGMAPQLEMPGADGIPVTAKFEGQRFFVRASGVVHATPLFVALLFVEATDIIFAIDSVPAIFALTREPLIVFTSNVFAILGLRALYFLLAGAIDMFHMLKYGLALVLIFVGLKMAWLNEAFGGKFPIGISLAVIAALVGASIAVSLVFPKSRQQSL